MGCGDFSYNHQIIYQMMVKLNSNVLKKKSPSMNPLFAPFETPFEVPPFENIKAEDFEPALRKGMEIQAEKIREIANDPNPPTFENTVEAYEASGKYIREMLNIFFNLNLAHTNDKLQETAKTLNPELSKHGDEIKMNVRLFGRIEQLWKKIDTLDLTEEESMLLEKTYKSFAKNGANLPDGEKSRLMEINSELSSLTLEFGQNILKDTNENQATIDDASKLEGIPESLKEAAGKAAASQGLEGKWAFYPNQSTYLNLLTYAENRELRKDIWEAYTLRGNRGNSFDNKTIIQKIVNLRTKKAALLGFPDYASYVLEDSMAGNSGEVFALLEKLWEPAREIAAMEEVAIAAIAKDEGLAEVKPYDWLYFAEKIRKEKFDLSESEMLPYFSLEQVREGIFQVTQKLYGIRLHPLENLPVYHREVVCYKVEEGNGKHIGLLYMDLFARPSKQGGAWMTKFRAQSYKGNERVPPVISIVCNFTPAAGNEPAFLNPDEVKTFFHEFGHSLHGLLSDVKHETLAGTAVPRDFVELPSQLMENWAFEPAVLKSYAKHYQTGKTIPEGLVAKIKKSERFNQGFALTEYLAAALLDISYHTRTDDLPADIIGFEEHILEKYGLTSSILPRYRSTYFNHIFAGGYAASYYSYIWAEILDADVFHAFQEKGLYDGELAWNFRKEILEKGGSRDATQMFLNLLGKSPQTEPLLKRKFGKL
jgi:peptidyl-dipeptidase Dcp